MAVAEADYLILSRLGVDVQLAFLDDLAAGTFVVDCLDRKELGLARDLARRYSPPISTVESTPQLLKYLLTGACR